ncbi:hypothetical protein AUP41_07010 [Thalassospira xiamenensis]|jgi:hypothetical protein|nr:hypothetical protein AUP41_07010 [Thalassospira xiamenensis]
MRDAIAMMAIKPCKPETEFPWLSERWIKTTFPRIQGKPTDFNYYRNDYKKSVISGSHQQVLTPRLQGIIEGVYLSGMD